MRAATRPAAAMLLLAAVLGCGGGASADRSDSVDPAVSTADARTPIGETPETTAVYDTLVRTRAASVTAPTTLTAVRAATRAAGLERMVFEFDDALPGYTVELTGSRPAACGSGRPADVDGDAYLVVRLRPARAHESRAGGQESTIGNRARGLGDGPVMGATLICDFEGTVEWVLGLDGRRPFRVFTLPNPPRVVVDVQAGTA